MNILQLINIAQILAGIAYALYTMCRNYIQLNQRMRAQAVRKPKYVAGFQAAHGYALPSPTRASWLPMLAWGSHIIVIYMCGLPCWPRTPQCESSVCLSYMRGFWKATMFTPLPWASWQPMLMCRSPFVCIARRGESWTIVLTCFHPQDFSSLYIAYLLISWASKLPVVKGEAHIVWPPCVGVLAAHHDWGTYFIRSIHPTTNTGFLAAHTDIAWPSKQPMLVLRVFRYSQASVGGLDGRAE
ncbi:hypothetical protein PC9H_009079 [Pleurotus ostreatus]|uniref:Uncharacterized protein n=1 Tax=Pleurotus ostreatus TaxID=5322 RepID=A0A8H6ZQ17_PLEOS|nr:uncharacterized protein PC9H_009079 [Pleurotus ostreatus]KAF7426710.1 hypothetical protein PC9H_009079 [Pleurotus ostreatus]